MSINFDHLTQNTSRVFKQSLAEPSRELGGVFIEASEKMLSMQMDSCKVYCDIAFGQLKKMAEIHTVEQAGDFVWGQVEPVGQFNKQLLKDCKSLVAFNSELGKDVRAVFSTKPAVTPEAAGATTQAKTTETKQAEVKSAQAAAATDPAAGSASSDTSAKTGTEEKPTESTDKKSVATKAASRSRRAKKA